MGRRLIDVDLDNLHDAPPEVRAAVFWETDDDVAREDPDFEKEEWFSTVMLQWGTCAKMAVDDDRGAVAFAEFAPPAFFPRLRRFRCGRVSGDAVYLSYCFVVAPRRGFGLGTQLVRAAARDVMERGFQALEAVGDRDWRDGWVLPAPFLAANGFQVIREDPRFPLMRLDLREAMIPEEEADAAEAVPLPAAGAA